VSSDFSVITTLCYCGGYIYVVDVDRDRSEWNGLMTRVLAMAKKHNPIRRVLIENASAGISLVQELIRTTKLPIVRMIPKDSKLERAMAVTGYFEGNRVLWPTYAPWQAECVSELLNFPGGRHDDFVDSLVQGVGYLMNNSMFTRERQTMIATSENRMGR
jgi:predicted phage terminase large subunit-like protein